MRNGVGTGGTGRDAGIDVEVDLVVRILPKLTAEEIGITRENADEGLFGGKGKVRQFVDSLQDVDCTVVVCLNFVGIVSIGKWEVGFRGVIVRGHRNRNAIGVVV